MVEFIAIARWLAALRQVLDAPAEHAKACNSLSVSARCNTRVITLLGALP
jgi:hypothetical protein